MTLNHLLKLLANAKLPLVVAGFGLFLNFGGSNVAIKNMGATVGLMASGCAIATATRRDGHLREVRRLQQTHERQTAGLQTSVSEALKDVSVAQQVAHQQSVFAAQTSRDMNKLKVTLSELRADRDQARDDTVILSQQVNAAAGSLNTCHSDNSLLAGELEGLREERMNLIYELYETVVTETSLGSAIAGLESQFQNSSAYQLTQKKRIKSELTKARASFHSELTEAEAKIKELEETLERKTREAVSLIGDISKDADGSLRQFSGKAGAQHEVINGLKIQIDEMRKTNKALTYRRFDNVGTDNIMGNRLIDYLAKHGSTYGAFHHEREGHNGRLKVWLAMIDAPLKQAQDSLDDLEGDLKLYAKPAVKVDRGMHLFTLATEKEYAAEKTYEDNLNRLEKDFDLMNHIRLVGGTGSGKSTFLDNLIWLGRLLWPTAEMDLLDPKAPYTKWQGGLTPDFKNLECVEAIENISTELRARFDKANKIADEFGNDSPEFERYVGELPYKLFVLDEAQYLHRIARAEDNKDKPKGIRANTVRDSLLDCLGVGRALKVKGYFITQSSKCSKLNMNEDDFDNATSIFLNAAIGNALEGELKGAFASSKIDRVTAEYESRKASGLVVQKTFLSLNQDGFHSLNEGYDPLPS